MSASMPRMVPTLTEVVEPGELGVRPSMAADSPVESSVDLLLDLPVDITPDDVPDLSDPITFEAALPALPAPSIASTTPLTAEDLDEPPRPLFPPALARTAATGLPLSPPSNPAPQPREPDLILGLRSPPPRPVVQQPMAAQQAVADAVVVAVAAALDKVLPEVLESALAALRVQLKARLEAEVLASLNQTLQDGGNTDAQSSS
ncbi:hypothetical protein [Roseateles koreensis]|uniref:Uncharacterized protein n=1 Tax=Roseateles koreensis TaxID=2987526 RepID=A0ABT5KNF0_9BURK|nr:hypothetical protein [Roseateles koreensis]MDC8784440.1 hypothetical protein [Roseateles koreensis]